jgi:uncharacterized membrane protein YeaQ/YmgE (transglycosylase-associated protein family)
MFNGALSRAWREQIPNLPRPAHPSHIGDESIRIRRIPMSLSNESLLIIVLAGIFSGWLAGKIVDGGGFGLIGDLIVGVIGAFFGDWLMPRLNIHLGVGLLALILNATIGAIVLLVIIRVIAGARGWGGGRLRRW